MGNRFVCDGKDIIVTHNCDSMTCRDCIYKMRNIAGFCYLYDPKPKAVIDGGECPKKKTN